MCDDTSSKDLLLEMGFPLEKIVQALATTGSTEIEELINWMENNEVYETLPIPIEKVNDGPSHTPINPKLSLDGEKDKESKDEAEDSLLISVQVLKCNTCQKLLKTSDLATLHTAKTGHTDFEESQEDLKPLTEEERKAKLLELQSTIAKRREEKAQQEEDEAFKKEQERRKQGKEYMSLREQIRDQEMAKLAEERKREKMEDRMAKQRIKDLIERDRMERMKKFSYPGSDMQGSNGDQNGDHAEIPIPMPVKIEQPVTDYEYCDLQIRLNNGKVLKKTFGAKETLAAVRLYVTINRSDGVSPTEPFNLMTSFPKKVFSDDDMEKPLTELDLVPKAVLIVTKKP